MRRELTKKALIVRAPTVRKWMNIKMEHKCRVRTSRNLLFHLEYWNIRQHMLKISLSWRPRDIWMSWRRKLVLNSRFSALSKSALLETWIWYGDSSSNLYRLIERKDVQFVNTKSSCWYKLIKLHNSLIYQL